LHALAKAPGGLLLVAGAAGAGKSTTAAALLECRNSEISGHILALEENTEYLLASKKSLINQQQIGADIASWHSAYDMARNCAADVVYISEINDESSASAALALAQAGVLCIATLNAGTPVDALIRFLQHFPEGERHCVQLQLGTALRAVVLQKLMRTKAGPRVAVCEILAPSERIVQHLERGEFSALRALDLSQQAKCQSLAQDMIRLQNNDLNFEDSLPEAVPSISTTAWGNTMFAEVGESARAAVLGHRSAGAASSPITLSLKS
jgi:twitching motility protein PilU